LGDFLQAGHTYADGTQVNAANLNEHVNEAIIKPAAISARTLKDPAALSDELLINDAGVLKRVTLQQLYALIVQPGAVVQTQYVEYDTFTVLTNVIPFDDTIPQNTEGTEILSVSITPRFASSQILCRFLGAGDVKPEAVSSCAALFRSGSVSAIASTFWASPLHYTQAMAIEYLDSPATTSALTYTIRVGPGAAGFLVFNGVHDYIRFLGGSSRAVLTLQEIKR
jgi:hypothetical protein